MSVDDERADAMNQGLNEQAFRNAWHAFRNTPIDLLNDSDDETCKCLSNAIRTFLRSTVTENGAPKPYSKTNECPSCHEQYTDGQTCRAVGGRGGCPMGGDL